eukprot:scaffold91522_cov61-Phaeocystis_antarctica.AAC.2
MRRGGRRRAAAGGPIVRVLSRAAVVVVGIALGVKGHGPPSGQRAGRRRRAQRRLPLRLHRCSPLGLLYAEVLLVTAVGTLAVVLCVILIVAHRR